MMNPHHSITFVELKLKTDVRVYNKEVYFWIQQSDNMLRDLQKWDTYLSLQGKFWYN